MSINKFLNQYRIESARAKWHDYDGGSYFVTICTQGREWYFGKIQNGEMILSQLGLVAEDCLQKIHSHFPNVEVPLSVVMPNHIHAIIVIDNHVETQNFASLQQQKCKPRFGPQSKNLASVVRGFKIGVTKYARQNNIPFDWQSRYHDHIIRDQMEMNRIADYILNNVSKWEMDCFWNDKEM